MIRKSCFKTNDIEGNTTKQSPSLQIIHPYVVIIVLAVESNLMSFFFSTFASQPPRASSWYHLYFYCHYDNSSSEGHTHTITDRRVKHQPKKLTVSIIRVDSPPSQESVMLGVDDAWKFVNQIDRIV